MKKKLYFTEGCWMEKDAYIQARTRQLQELIKDCKRDIGFCKEEIEKKKKYIEDFEKEIVEMQKEGWE